MNYLVADIVTRIKNAAMAKRKQVKLPYSRLGQEIAEVLVQKRFLESVQEDTVDGKKVLVGKVRYENRVPVLTDILLVSKPSLRIYVGIPEIVKRKRRGMKTLVLSTNKGVLTDKEALKEKTGGELLFEVM